MSEKTLADLMTWNIVSIDQHATLARAAEIMQSAHISSVLVTDMGRPVGIITERNILIALEEKVPGDTTVAAMMGHPLVGAPQDMTIHDAYHFMAQKGVRHLLVTDTSDKPVGIVTESDFRFHLGLEFFRRLQDVRTVMSARMPVLPPATPVRDAISAMATRDAHCTVVAVDGKPIGMFTERDAVRLYRDGEDALARPISEVMSSPVTTTSIDTPLHDAIELMQTHRIRHLVVIGGSGEAAGILSEHDVVRQLETEYLDYALKDNRRTRKQLRESELRRRAVFNQAREYMGILDLDGTLRDANRSALEMIGDPAPEEVIGQPFWNTPWWSHDPTMQARLRRAFADVASGRSSRFEATLAAADGKVHDVDFQLHPILDEGGRIVLAMAEGTDITERHQNEEQRRLALQVFRSSHDGILITDPQGIILDVNQAFTSLTGYSRAEAVGRSARILHSGHHDKEFFQQMFDTIARENHWLGEIWNRNKAGEINVVLMTISAVRDTGGAITHYVGVFSDITQRKESERRLEHLAQHDALTDLPNRSLFRDRLVQAIQKSRRDRQLLALFFIDLDRFKEINDQFGHMAGDRLLVEAAQRIRACVRNSDTVARLGGDEFTVLLQGVTDRSEAANIAAEIIAALTLPFPLGEHSASISASIGIALCPNDCHDADDLTHAADRAMYAAKARGRNRYIFAC